MALFTGHRSADPMIGEGTQSMLRRRLGELWGAGFLAVAALIGMALYSYDPSDPSLFSATGAAPRNLLGQPGAILAAPLMHFLGLGAWFFVAFPVAWGARMILHLGEERIWARLLMVPLAVISGAVFASTHSIYPGWPLPVGLGGVFGDNGAMALIQALPLADAMAIRLLSLGVGILTVAVWAAAMGFVLSEVKVTLLWMLRSLAEVIGLTARRPARRARKPKRSGSYDALAPEGEDSRAFDPPDEPHLRMPDPSEPESSPEAPLMADEIGTPVKPRRRRLPLPKLALPSISGLFRRKPKTERDDLQETGAVPDIRLEPTFGEGPEPDAAGQDGERTLSNAIRALRDGTPEADDSDAKDNLLGVDRETAMAALLADGHQRKTVGTAAQKPLKKSKQAQREAQPYLALDGLQKPQAYDTPALALLQSHRDLRRRPVSEIALEENARMLETVLEDYGIRGEIVAVKPGPVVTLYELEPAPGLKASRVIGLADDIARSMSALSARISTMPGRSVIGIELPNSEREKVLLREVLEAAEFGDNPNPLLLALGKDIEGAPIVANLAKMPHLLIAGTTGSGKSVAINTMILSLLYRQGPEDCRLIMIDPKMLELSVYDGIPHLLAPVVTDPKKALVALKWVVAEMEERYRKMSKVGVRNIDGYNARVSEALTNGENFERTVQTGFDEATGEPIYETQEIEPVKLPLIVVIVDEMADLMMVAGKEIEACIQRLAQMARASGIHLIMATQRPSVDVITGTIKANFPTRISFQVTSKIDSRTIIGEQGAEQLLGQGDMLYMVGGGRIQRVHGPFVSDGEVEEVVMHLKTLGVPEYVSAVTDGGDEETQAMVDEKLGLASPGDSEDELYDKAVAIVARDRKCSTSYIQRKLAIGYNKAARLVEQMEDQGVVSSANAVGKREILIEER